MGLTTQSLRHAVKTIAANFESVDANLNEFNGKLGDVDLSAPLINGFIKLAAIADTLPEDVGKAMLDGAKAMTKTSGSSFGTLMALSLKAAAKQTKGKTEVPWSSLPDLLRAALDAMISHGGARLGDKTVMDSLDAVILEIQDMDEPELMLSTARAAADCALDIFLERECKAARSRSSEEKSVGLDDPGMVAFKSMLDLL